MRAITLGCLLITGQIMSAQVKIEKTAWQGWANCYKITNGEVEIIVTSDIGPRIMRYGFVGGQNFLWEQKEGPGQKRRAEVGCPRRTPDLGRPGGCQLYLPAGQWARPDRDQGQFAGCHSACRERDRHRKADRGEDGCRRQRRHHHPPTEEYWRHAARVRLLGAVDDGARWSRRYRIPAPRNASGDAAAHQPVGHVGVFGPAAIRAGSSPKST